MDPLLRQLARLEPHEAAEGAAVLDAPAAGREIEALDQIGVDRAAQPAQVVERGISTPST